MTAFENAHAVNIELNDMIRAILNKESLNTISAVEWNAIFNVLVRAVNNNADVLDSIQTKVKEILEGSVDFTVDIDAVTLSKHPINDFVLKDDLNKTLEDTGYFFKFTKAPIVDITVDISEAEYLGPEVTVNVTLTNGKTYSFANMNSMYFQNNGFVLLYLDTDEFGTVSVHDLIITKEDLSKCYQEDVHTQRQYIACIYCTSIGNRPIRYPTIEATLDGRCAGVLINNTTSVISSAQFLERLVNEIDYTTAAHRFEDKVAGLEAQIAELWDNI